MDRLTQRLFTALWPTPSLQAAIANWQATWEWPPRAALVQTDRLHATLHFLGDVPASRMTELTRALRLPLDRFELELGVGAVWPKGVAVVEPLATPPALTELHTRMAEVLQRLEFAVDARPYRPHVTLARRADGARPPPQSPALQWPVNDGYALVRSLPGGGGYEVIARFS